MGNVIPMRPRRGGKAVPPVNRAMALLAILQGKRAKKDGKPVTDCPYVVDGDVAQRFQARYWIRGWTHGR